MFTDPAILLNPFDKLILPLSKHYEEIVWFADPKVAATKEGTSGPQSLGWTEQLSKATSPKDTSKPLIQSPKEGRKYIELERMLSSIVFLHYFFLGSEEAYEKFTALQDLQQKLTWESFLTLHQFTKQVANTQELFKALEAMLVFSDAGKTPTAVQRAENFELKQTDHDDFIEALFHQKKEVIEHILPSFKLLSSDTQDLLINASSAMPIHLGHVLHLEGGSRMFSRFENAVQSGKVTKDLLNFVFLIAMCDVSASLTHINKEGSLSFTEDTYQGYQMVKMVLEGMVGARWTSKQALSYYLKLRADHLGANIYDPQENFLVRMACWLRLYTKEDYELLKNALQELPEAALKVACEQFDLEDGINVWKRNPTYGPAVLVNLANFQKSGEAKQIKIKRALEGACCLALWCQAYGLQVMNLDRPVNFNDMAGIAAKFPEKFQLKNFNVKDFELNENNLVVFKPKELSNTLTPISPSLTWSKDQVEMKQVDPLLKQQKSRPSIYE